PRARRSPRVCGWASTGESSGRPPQTIREVRPIPSGRRQLIAPRMPTLARLAREQFEVRAAEEPPHARVSFVELLAVRADRRHDPAVDAIVEPQWVADLRDDARFGILPGGVAIAPVEAFAARIQLDPIEGEARESKPPSLDDLAPHRHIRPGAPQEQRAVVSGERSNRQCLDRVERHGLVVPPATPSPPPPAV